MTLFKMDSEVGYVHIVGQNLNRYGKMIRLPPHLASASIELKSQDASKRRGDALKRPKDGLIDWNGDAA